MSDTGFIYDQIEVYKKMMERLWGCEFVTILLNNENQLLVLSNAENAKRIPAMLRKTADHIEADNERREKLKAHINKAGTA